MIRITMISGEKIIGKLIQEDSLYMYVETEIKYDDMALAIFGKEYCEQHSTLINKLPKDEIINVEY